MTPLGRLMTTALVTLGMVSGGLLISAGPALAVAPETPVTEAAAAVTGTTATLNGELNPLVEAMTGYYFAYNTNEECTAGPTTEPGAEAKVKASKVSAPLTGLEPNQEYTFCVVATHLEGETTETTFGSPLKFKTLAIKPTVVSESVPFVTPFEARLEGIVNPNNQLTTCEFQYGAEPSLVTSTTVPCEQASIEGGEQGIGLTIGGLEPKTTYYYRVLVTNATGTTEGTIENFTTSTLEPPIIDGESATAITPSAATLEAVINPNFQETTCKFEYGIEPLLKSGTTTTEPCPASLGSSGSGVGTAVALSGLESGQTYYYRVIAENGTPPATNGTIEHFTTQGSPLVSTGEAQAITRTTVALSGTVNPVGAETTYYFQYISETGYQAALAKGATNPYLEGETTVPVSAGSSYETQTAGPIRGGGLLPGTTYHYTLVARNAVGSTIGHDGTFTTLSPTPPTVITEGASAVSQNTATISGAVSTNSLQTNYGFEIATEPGNYGPPTGLGSLGGALTETVTLTLGELQPGTTYYYRITATNTDGTSQGEPETFTTPGFPTLLIAPSAPPLIATPPIAFPAGNQANTGSNTVKKLTNKQKLAKALKTCKKEKPKSKRTKCQKQANRKYATPKKK